MNDISKVAYELYKQDWIDTHTTREIRLDDIRNWGETEIENDNEELACSYEECREEFGYSGEIFACYDEFLDNEYQDSSYMKKLLQSDSLINAYLDDKKVDLPNGVGIPEKITGEGINEDVAFDWLHDGFEIE